MSCWGASPWVVPPPCPSRVPVICSGLPSSVPWQLVGWGRVVHLVAPRSVTGLFSVFTQLESPRAAVGQRPAKDWLETGQPDHRPGVDLSVQRNFLPVQDKSSQDSDKGFRWGDSYRPSRSRETPREQHPLQPPADR